MTFYQDELTRELNSLKRRINAEDYEQDVANKLYTVVNLMLEYKDPRLARKIEKEFIPCTAGIIRWYLNEVGGLRTFLTKKIHYAKKYSIASTKLGIILKEVAGDFSHISSDSDEIFRANTGILYKSKDNLVTAIRNSIVSNEKGVITVKIDF